MSDDKKNPTIPAPRDHDEATPESIAVWLLNCVTQWQQANTVEDRTQWEKETARVIRCLMPFPGMRR